MSYIIDFFTKTPPRELIGQLIGIAGMIIAVLSFQMKKSSRYCIMQGISGASFALSFFILGAPAGAILNAVNILRGFAFGMAPEKSRKPFFVILLVMYTAASVLTLDLTSPLYLIAASILVGIAQLAGTVVMYISDGRLIRIVQNAYISPAWMFYNICNVSIGGILCEAFNIISSFVSLFRFRKTGFAK